MKKRVFEPTKEFKKNQTKCLTKPNSRTFKVAREMMKYKFLEQFQFQFSQESCRIFKKQTSKILLYETETMSVDLDFLKRN